MAIAFKTEKEPKYFFIQVDKSPPFRARKNLFKSIFKNREGLVQRGKNILPFEKGARDDLKDFLQSIFLRNSRVTVTISLSHDGKIGDLFTKNILRSGTGKGFGTAGEEERIETRSLWIIYFLLRSVDNS